jgi:uroporphyrinogen decarboxylase
MDRLPWHLVEPGMKQPSFEGYDFPTPEQFVNPNLKENAEKVMAANPDSFSIINIGWGLFEQTWRMRGFENSMIDAAAEPDFYGELLDRLTELRLSMVEQCVDVPADAIMFGDDWGDQRGVILGPELWREFLKPCWTRVYEAVHAQDKFVISHSCGSVADIMPDIIEIGLDVLESVQPEPSGMNPYELKRKYGDRITFWGCLGSQSTIQFGTPQGIRDEVQRLRREMGKGGGYILAPAKGLQPGTPLENAIAVVDAFTSQN